jgi:hypothetical protein
MLELTFSFFLTMLSSLYGEMLFCVNVVVMVLLFFFWFLVLVRLFTTSSQSRIRTYVRSLTFTESKQQPIKNIQTNQQTNKQQPIKNIQANIQTNEQTKNNL